MVYEGQGLERRLLYLTRCRVRGMDPKLFHANTHEGFELLHVVSGGGNFIYNDRLYELRPGRLFLINAGRFHYSNPSQVEEYVRSGVEFQPTRLLEQVQALGLNGLLAPFFSGKRAYVDLGMEENTEADRLFTALWREATERREGYLLAVESLIGQLLILAARCAPTGEEGAAVRDAAGAHVVQIIEYVNEHLADFDLEEMAGSLYLSKFHLCHIFKEATGLTIRGYLQEKRIEAAQQALAATAAPVSKIAVELGFGSFSVFSRTFHSLVGVTPRDYRRRCREGGGLFQNLAGPSECF